MKAIFMVLCCSFVTPIQAQSQQFIVNIENLNGLIRRDTLDFRHIGVQISCAIQDQYETIKRLPVDTFPDAEGRTLSYEFYPPV